MATAVVVAAALVVVVVVVVVASAVAVAAAVAAAVPAMAKSPILKTFGFPLCSQLVPDFISVVLACVSIHRIKSQSGCCLLLIRSVDAVLPVVGVVLGFFVLQWPF